MDIIVRGHKLEGNFLDADFIDRYEESINKYREELAAARAKEYTRASDGYRALSACIEAHFDRMFGAGTSEELFDGCHGDVDAHGDAVMELSDAHEASLKAFNDKTNQFSQKQSAVLAKANAGNTVRFNQFAAQAGGNRKQRRRKH